MATWSLTSSGRVTGLHDLGFVQDTTVVSRISVQWISMDMSPDISIDISVDISMEMFVDYISKDRAMGSS